VGDDVADRRMPLIGVAMQAASEPPLLTLGIAILWIPGSGGVLIDPVLADRRTTREYPKETTVDGSTEDGPELRQFEHWPVGSLISSGLLPGGLLNQFAGPDSPTLRYRVTEEIVRPGLRFGLFAVAAEWNGQPIMAPVGDVPTISVGGMATVLSSGGKTATRMALYFGLSGQLT
jgi:hypothetical protein